MIMLWILSGSARTLDPTNKNCAPELSTFGIIIEANLSEVQWKGLALEKLPSWSQLISAPGKYELTGRDLRLSTLCTNCGDPGRGGVEWQIMFLPWKGFKYHIQTKMFNNMQIPGNNYQPVQTFCWTETGLFRENRSQADIVTPCNQASYKYQASRPATFSFAQRWYSNQWSNREMLLLLVENYTQYPALLVWNITSWGNFCRPHLELFVTLLVRNP